MSNYYTDLDIDLGMAEEGERDMLHRDIKRSEELYEKADQARVGSKIACPGCEMKHKKTTYHNKFCSNKCKDRYWNLVDGERRARAAHFNK